MGDAYAGWAIVELMGHRRLGGRVSEVEQYGTVMLRVDVPTGVTDGDTSEESWTTQFYGGGSIYCLTPSSEDSARLVARRAQPAPVHAYELTRPVDHVDDDDDDEGSWRD